MMHSLTTFLMVLFLIGMVLGVFYVAVLGVTWIEAVMHACGTITMLCAIISFLSIR